MSTTRAAFENWVSKRYPMAEATDSDDRFESALWECWQAAAPAEPVAPADPTHDCGLKRGAVFCRECDLETIEKGQMVEAPLEAAHPTATITLPRPAEGWHYVLKPAAPNEPVAPLPSAEEIKRLVMELDDRPGHWAQKKRLAIFAAIDRLAAQPVAITAKLIVWESAGANEWHESRYGFYVTHSPDDDDELPYCAAWGEGDVENFATEAEAKAWCQQQIDAWIADCAVLPEAPKE
jgi:hypothetical protein